MSEKSNNQIIHYRDIILMTSTCQYMSIPVHIKTNIVKPQFQKMSFQRFYLNLRISSRISINTNLLYIDEIPDYLNIKPVNICM